MTRNAATLAAGLTLGLAGIACQEHEFHPPSREERVAEADSLYSAALFDTIRWADRQTRIDAGNLVYADECRRCHGPLGRGETDYAEEQELDVPSLVAPDWELDGDLDALRRRVFVGHVAGMPTWGVAGISPRQLDAAAFYILEQLRPEVLGR